MYVYVYLSKTVNQTYQTENKKKTKPNYTEFRIYLILKQFKVLHIKIENPKLSNIFYLQNP